MTDSQVGNRKRDTVSGSSISNWRRVAVLCAGLGVCLFVLATARSAQAAPTISWVTKGPDCELPYNPYTHETATPLAQYDDPRNLSYPNDHSYRCSLDEDHDGLDDHIENVIAKCFAPYLRFDSNENHLEEHSYLPGDTEPVALYTVEPTDKHNQTVSLEWVLVFDEDGGFELTTGAAGYNSHMGDTQWLDMRVKLEQLPDLSWEAHLEMVHPTDAFWEEGTPGPDDDQVKCADFEGTVGLAGYLGAHAIVPPLPDPLASLRGRACTPSTGHEGHLELTDTGHPVVYVSAGKHHTFLHAQNEYPWMREYLHDPILPDITLFGQYDRALGDGKQILSKTETASGQPLNVGYLAATSVYPPAVQLAACWTARDEHNAYQLSCACNSPGCPPQAPQDLCSAAWQTYLDEEAICTSPINSTSTPSVNKCLADEANLPGVPSDDFLTDAEFNSFGYKGSLANTKKFCGTDPPGCNSEADPIIKWLRWQGPDKIDEDGDGVDNFNDTCPLKYENTPAKAMEQDAAQDGFGPDCDPEQLLDPTNSFVHGYDRWVGRGNLEKKLPAFVPDYQHNYPWLAGMLDSDGDGKINGDDFCPFTAAGTVNTNQGGEALAFPPGSERYAHYGYSHRGNACDPFASTFVKPLFPWAGTMLLNVDCYNADTNHPWFDTTSAVQVDYAAVKGLSANDPALHPNPDTYANRANELLGKSTTVPATLERCACNFGDWQDCAHNALSHCWVDQGLNGVNPDVPKTPESGWHPLGPSDCEENPSTHYCEPMSVTARPTIPRDCDPYKGVCNFSPSDWNGWEIRPQRELWDWEAEKKKHPDHLPDDLFTNVARFAGDLQAPPDPLLDPTNPEYSPTYQRSKYRFLFGSEVAREASLVQPTPLKPNPFYWPDTSKKPYVEPQQYGQEPDVNISVNQVASQHIQSRRLRSYFALWGDRPEDSPYLSGAHRVKLQPLPPLCQHVWDKIDIHQALINIIWPPDPEGSEMLDTSPISVVSQPRGYALIASHPDVAPLADVLDLSTGQTYPIVLTVSDYGAPTNSALSAMAAIGSSTELAQLLSGAPSGADVVPLATRKDGWSTLPELLVVLYADPTSSFLGTWLELSPLGIDPSAGASYAIGSVGQLPADFQKGVLRADSIAGAAVEFAEPGVDRRAGLWRFDSGEWSETPLPADLPARQHAAYLVHNAVLFRAGGADSDGNLAGDTIALETRSGREYDKTPTWAPRSDPALAWDEERGGLVYGGGFDASGAPHSDLWVAGLPGVAPQLMLPDASGPDAPQLDASSLVLAGAESRQAVVLGTSRVENAIASAWRGAVDGWHPQSLLSLDTGTGMDRCSDGSTPRLCADGASDWFGDPGHMACSPLATGQCTSASQPHLAGTQELPVEQARSADLDVMTTWVGADAHVEDWSDSDPPVLRGRIGVKAPVISLRADNGTVAVATRRGLVIVSQSDGQLRASDPLPLCGRPLAAEPLHDGRWVVSTSAGIALISVDYAGTPSIDEAALLLPDKNGWGAYHVQPSQCATHPVCRVADAMVCAGGRCGDGRAVSPLALVGDRVAIAPALGVTEGWLHGAQDGSAHDGHGDHGHHYDSDGHGSGHDEDHPARAPVLLLGHDGDGWHVLSETTLERRVEALRASGAWVYAVTHPRHGQHVQQLDPALGVTGDQFTSAETHDVPWWVERRDTTDRRLRMIHGDVQVAEVAP